MVEQKKDFETYLMTALNDSLIKKSINLSNNKYIYYALIDLYL
mgnify:FL=1